MPRPRDLLTPRKRARREPCDCTECQVVVHDPTLGNAVAIQQPPPKCLILLSTRSIDVRELERWSQQMDSAIPHLDAVISQGCSGLLALRDGGQEPDMQHLENLFGTIPVYTEGSGKGAEERGSALRSMAAMMVSPSERARQLACTAGFTQASDPSEIGLDKGLQDTSAATKIAEIIDFESLRPLDQPIPKKAANDSIPETDLLLVDMGSIDTEQDLEPGSQLRSIDKLLSELNKKNAFRESVLLVVLLKIWDEDGKTLPEPGGGPLTDPGGRLKEEYKGMVRPKQSYEFASMDEVKVSRQEFFFCAQRLPFVVRQDMLQSFPFQLAQAPLGDGCILAERLLPSLAYKLNCAPKYGA